MGRDSDVKLPRDAIKAKYTNILADRQSQRRLHNRVNVAKKDARKRNKIHNNSSETIIFFAPFLAISEISWKRKRENKRMEQDFHLNVNELWAATWKVPRKGQPRRLERSKTPFHSVDWHARSHSFSYFFLSFFFMFLSRPFFFLSFLLNQF